MGDAPAPRESWCQGRASSETPEVHGRSGVGKVTALDAAPSELRMRTQTARPR